MRHLGLVAKLGTGILWRPLIPKQQRVVRSCRALSYSGRCRTSEVADDRERQVGRLGVAPHSSVVERDKERTSDLKKTTRSRCIYLPRVWGCSTSNSQLGAPS